MDSEDARDAKELGRQLGGLAIVLEDEAERRRIWALDTIAWCKAYLRTVVGQLQGAFQQHDPENPKRWAKLDDQPGGFLLFLGTPNGRFATMSVAVSAFGDVVGRIKFSGHGDEWRFPPFMLEARASTESLKETLGAMLRAAIEELRRTGTIADYEEW